MRLILSTFLFSSVIVFAASAHAQICKWVDDNGVTHYSTECPDQGEADVLDIETEPLEEPGDEASQAAQAEEDFAPLLPPGAQAEIALAPPEPSVVEDDEALARCVQATTNLVVLQAQAPVFYNNVGVLIHGWSERARAYQGARTYVDDQDRNAEIRQYENYLAENCGRSEAERRQIADLVVHRNLQGMQDEICADRQHLLNRLQGGQTGLPTPAARELQAYIRRNCG